MNFRILEEEKEYVSLSPFATKSRETLGRTHPEEPCFIRTEFARDRDRILHSKAFRRLKHKTQVFLSPKGDHYRDRLTHTLEVSQIARTIAKGLNLNEALAEAIALSHDLGHPPFGHSGEAALHQVMEGGFSHYLQSLRVVDVIEKKGRGLNLTWEVKDGILNHRTSGSPSTLEGKVVRLSDKIAYISHDADDAIRAGILSEDDIPKEISQVLGWSFKERLNTLVIDVITQSQNKDDIILSKETEEAMKALRKFMFSNVYMNKTVKREEDKSIQMLQMLYQYYLDHIQEVPEEFLQIVEERKEPYAQAVCDYIAGMTDTYALHQFKQLFEPKSWGGVS